MKDDWINALIKLYEKKLLLGTDIMKGTKREKLEGYLEVLEKARQEVINSRDKDLEKLLKQFYQDLYVIKEENIPASLYTKGTSPNSFDREEYKNKKIRQAIDDQINTLDRWIDYFLWDDDAKSYSGWEVFWVLEGLQKLGRYDYEIQKYTKRDETTLYPFPEINKEAVSNTVELVNQYLRKKNGKKELKAALGQANFKILYEYCLNQINLRQKNQLSTEGIWVKYQQGSDYRGLYNSLQGYKTGWCTAARESYASEHLCDGDFYIYYTIDENGEYKVPRLAIRTNETGDIAEARGIADNQNLEGNMTQILIDKLSEFKDKEKYSQNIHDMVLLAEIYEKNEKGIDLTKEELLFLYEVEAKIEGFGIKSDPRIEEIKSKRDQRKDLCYMFDCTESQIATTIEELSCDTVAYLGDLNYEKDSINCPNLKYIIGSAYFPNLKSAEGLHSLKTVSKDMEFSSLKYSKGLENLEIVVGRVDLESLISAEGLRSLRCIGGDACFHSLVVAKGLNKLKKIGRSARFLSLMDARGLDSLEIIVGNAYFRVLPSAEGLEHLKEIGYSARFSSLESSKGLGNLYSIGDDADFPVLTDAEWLSNLRYIGGDAYFPALKSPKGLERLISIGDSADFPELTTDRWLINLKRIGGDANFGSLQKPNNINNVNIKGQVQFSKTTKLFKKVKEFRENNPSELIRRNRR